MGRLAWSQVRFRLARTLALIAGVLVAATAFTVLTAASRTAQVRTTGVRCRGSGSTRSRSRSPSARVWTWTSWPAPRHHR
jgi:hypothetical protein